MKLKEKFKEKMKGVQKAMDAIEKQFGKGAIMTLGDAPPPESIPSISSGSIGIDWALGTGGYPRGRILEIYGPESSGKTTLTLHAIAEAQKQGGVCAFIDAEHALDVTYAKALGVDTETLLISQPDFGEQALEITNSLIQSESVDLIVIDSVAALTPKAELDGDMADHHVGLQARMMSKAMRKMTAMSHKFGTSLIFINQTRMKIGVSFGSPETTTGGNALKFYASVRLDVRKIGKIKTATDVIGNRTRVKVVKNKMAPPFREAEFDIRFGEGISIAAEVVDRALDLNIIKKAGTWFSIDGVRLSQGRENAIAKLKSDPQLLAEILNKINATPRDQSPQKAEPSTKKSEAA